LAPNYNLYNNNILKELFKENTTEGIKRSTTTLPHPLEERISLPPHTKSAVFLNPANPPSPTHMGWGLGGGIGANV